jgi:hypothetical protein
VDGYFDDDSDDDHADADDDVGDKWMILVLDFRSFQISYEDFNFGGSTLTQSRKLLFLVFCMNQTYKCSKK